MQKTDPRYHAYIRVLQNHLRAAMGCTAPIAIAYASALARETLGQLPDSVQVLVSGNIIKNAKAVTVPNTNGRKGIEAACAAGIVAGDSHMELQVIAGVQPEQIAQIDAYMQRGVITVGLKSDARLFDILICAAGGGHSVRVRIADRHTHVVEIERDGESLLCEELSGEDIGDDPDEALLTIEGIYDFACTCDTADVCELLDRQIACNTAIAQEGLTGRWGASIGKILLDSFGDDVSVRACAYAAAGSDARMSGCELPVVINSGSGNQGLTVSLPVIEYAKERGVSRETLYRALVISNLVAIREKSTIGCLSAYCGAISAGCASGAGIAYLDGGDLDLINHTIVNGLAILSGTICDGAKPSCAAKIASAIHAALMGYRMALAGKEFRGGEGIIKKGVENTIASVGRLGKDGMKQTDQEILRIMIE